MSEEYRRSLGPRLARIDELWRGMARDPEPGKEELLRVVHSIAGAAGTFGLPAVSAAALRLELVLEPLCTRIGPPDRAESAGIDAGISELARSAGSASA